MSKYLYFRLNKIKN